MVVKKAEHCGIAGDTVGFTVFPGLRHIIVLRLRFHICLSQVDEKPALIASIRQSLAKINLNRIIKAAVQIVMDLFAVNLADIKTAKPGPHFRIRASRDKMPPRLLCQHVSALVCLEPAVAVQIPIGKQRNQIDIKPFF